MTKTQTAYCTLCGAALVGWTCPKGHPIDAPRSARLKRRMPALAVGLVALLVTLGLILALMSTIGQLSSLRDELTALQNSIRVERERRLAAGQTLAGIAERVSAIEAAEQGERTPSEIARRALRSVVTVVSTGSQGSGFVIRSSANSSLIVTNYHVVSDTWVVGGRSASVKRDAGTYPGTIEAVSPEYDLALIHVAIRIPRIPVSQVQPQPGDSVLVIGSPYGLEGSVTNGIVSGMRFGFLQFSAAVSPGSSGGPVLDSEGEVIGVVVSKVVARDVEGLAFAVPADDVCTYLVGC